MPKGYIYSPITIFAPPVAVFEDLSYQNTTIIAFSDGVSEAENTKREFFGTQRIALAVQNMENKSSMEIKDKLLHNIQAYTSGQEQSDDLTIVVVKV